MGHRRFAWGVACLIVTAWLIKAPLLGAKELSGAEVYSRNCGRCHNPRAPEELTVRQWQVVMHHMHARAYLTAEEVAALLDFFTTYARRKIGAVPQAQGEAVAALQSSVARGETLVAEKQCQGCHTIKGKGGKIGPPLDGILERRSKAWLEQQLSNPKGNNPTSVMPAYHLSQLDIESLLLYFKTIQ